MRLKKRRLPADYCRFDSELFYAFVISSSEATNRSGKLVRQEIGARLSGVRNDMRS